jgi:hypothetical protein
MIVPTWDQAWQDVYKIESCQGSVIYRRTVLTAATFDSQPAHAPYLVISRLIEDHSSSCVHQREHSKGLHARMYAT